jgi:hypothetical protein
MEYIVTSSKKVYGKINGEKLTESDILSAGGNVEFLIASEHIKKAGQTPKAVQAVKEEPEVKEVPQVFSTPVFNLDNEQGDK